MAAEPEMLPVIRNALDDIKGQDILCLDVRRQSTEVDYMVLASGNSARQVRALADSVMAQARQQGFRPLGCEGLDSMEWVLLDYLDVVVHIMLPEVRAYYDLERLWGQP